MTSLQRHLLLLVTLFCIMMGASTAHSEDRLLTSEEGDNLGIFTGHVSKINNDASLVRVRVDFANMKYLNKKDKVEFWNDFNNKIKCKGYILGKSNEYLLLKISEFDYCNKNMHISPGKYVIFFSQDLINNISMGRELSKVLLKKRQAIVGRLDDSKKVLQSYSEKVDSVNKRYTILREKLELEWKKEIQLLDEDRSVMLKNFHDYQTRLGEIDLKLEQYRVGDQNLVEDRWALDSRLYFKK